MKTRSVHVAPVFDCQDEIQALRQAWDPLYGHVGPHVTLVFPFDSDLATDWLRAHVEACVAGMAPFTILLGPTVVRRGDYHVMEVDRGRRALAQLHSRLYTGELARFLRTSGDYRPHVTVGRGDMLLPQALPTRPTALVDAVVVEEIAPNGDSLPASVVELRG